MHNKNNHLKKHPLKNLLFSYHLQHNTYTHRQLWGLTATYKAGRESRSSSLHTQIILRVR